LPRSIRSPKILNRKTPAENAGGSNVRLGA
jgi:hypothetical protein